MNKLNSKLGDINSKIKWIRTYEPNRGVRDIEDTLKSISSLLGDIIKEIENLKTVDNNVIQ